MKLLMFCQLALYWNQATSMLQFSMNQSQHRKKTLKKWNTYKHELTWTICLSSFSLLKSGCVFGLTEVLHYMQKLWNILIKLCDLSQKVHVPFLSSSLVSANTDYSTWHIVINTYKKMVTNNGQNSVSKSTKSQR